MTVIASNTSALRSMNASTKANAMLSTAMERLSTGKRINSAKDDAAGLAIATSMDAQIRGMNQGIRNANDGISMAQTAEGALDEVSNMLGRMRELTVQAKNGSYSDSDKINIQAEITALGTQLDSALANTTFNGKSLFGATAADVKVQAGANAADTVTLKLAPVNKGTVTVNATTGAFTLGTGTDVPDAIKIARAVDVTKIDANAGAAGDFLSKFDDALKQVSNTRAGLGAAQNQLESAVNNLTSNTTNLSDAKSRIQDADFSAESTALAKASILSQASTAMLAQANQSQQSVLQLLK